MEENKIDFFNPGTILFFIMAFIADLCFMGMIGLLIPGVGLAIALLVLGAHYFIGLIIVAYFWGKTQGLLPKAILLLAWILPMPELTVGLIFVIIASNKIGAALIEAGALVVETAVIQGIAIGTGGAGEALEVGAAGLDVVAEGGALVVEGGAETIEFGADMMSEGAEIAEGAPGITEGSSELQGAGGGVEAGAEAPESSDVMADRNEKNPMENLQKELEEPQEEEEAPREEAEPEEDADEEREDKIRKRIQKVVDIADRTSKPQGDEDDGDEDDEYLEDAA